MMRAFHPIQEADPEMRERNVPLVPLQLFQGEAFKMQRTCQRVVAAHGQRLSQLICCDIGADALVRFAVTRERVRQNVDRFPDPVVVQQRDAKSQQRQVDGPRFADLTARAHAFLEQGHGRGRLALYVGEEARYVERVRADSRIGWPIQEVRQPPPTLADVSCLPQQPKCRGQPQPVVVQVGFAAAELERRPEVVEVSRDASEPSLLAVTPPLRLGANAEPEKPLKQSPHRRTALPGFLQLQSPVLTYGLEHVEACELAVHAYPENRAVDELGDSVDQREPTRVGAGAHGFERIQIEAADEYRCFPPNPLRGRREEAVAPFHRRFQCPLPRLRVAVAPGEELETMRQTLRDLTHRKRLEARRRELDSERHAVEPPAEVGRRLCLRRCQYEARRRCRPALLEQLDGVTGGHWRHRPQALARYTEGDAAGRQDVYAGACPQE